MNRRRGPARGRAAARPYPDHPSGSTKSRQREMISAGLRPSSSIGRKRTRVPVDVQARPPASESQPAPTARRSGSPGCKRPAGRGACQPGTRGTRVDQGVRLKTATFQGLALSRTFPPVVASNGVYPFRARVMRHLALQSNGWLCREVKPLTSHGSPTEIGRGVRKAQFFQSRRRT